MVGRAEKYIWSSAEAHLTGTDSAKLMDEWAWSELGLAEGWNEQLRATSDAAAEHDLRVATYGGRPFGDETFVGEIERLAGRPLRKQHPGPKRKTSSQAAGAD